MGGNVLFTIADYIEIGKNIADLFLSKGTKDQLMQEFKILENMGACKEQVRIVQRLINSGMSMEEVAWRLGRTYKDIKEICMLHINEDYDFSYIHAVRPLEDIEEKVIEKEMTEGKLNIIVLYNWLRESGRDSDAESVMKPENENLRLALYQEYKEANKN